ncbi:MAG TPA: DUF3488 and transglutaminase-like domain-containing protein, partial [Gammaproteobacteria bacterium]|nr:DUF3488 and transglutaminase-like domain-containing protein [Gammaproteobacteria bacterium]
MVKLERAQQVIPDRSIIAILAASAVVTAPLSLHIQPWISGAFVLCCAWRWLLSARQRPLPSATVRLTLALAGLAVMFATHGTILGRDAGVSFLILMISLKLLELRSLRDAHILIILDYFTILTGFLYSQSIYSAAYMAVGVLAVTAVLNNLNYETHQQSMAWHLRVAANLGLQALPLMLVMFFLFPRFAGPLWSAPGGHGGGSTGLSPDMAPGRISQLSQSDAVAFRVSFDGPVPAQKKLYWRGPVLWHTDGMHWTAGERPGFVAGRSLRYRARGAPVRYAVTLEPDRQNWLFALDLPASVPPIGRLTSDYELLSKRPVTERIHYPVSSYLNYNTQGLSPDERLRALQLPPRGNPRSRALARHWRATLPDDTAIVNRALRYFHNQPFVYTMTPPTLHGDQVDGFLFGTRRGFCEHYSSSFTWLMRAAGIPARVVTGYQGGQLNPMGDYLIVRQSDAHAWSEVWLQDRGWVRIDPTAAVAPERIELGLDPISQPDGAPVLFEGAAPQFVTRAWQAMGLGWDALNYNWNQWVLGYGRQKQLQLLSRMGVPFSSVRAIALGLVASLGVLFCLLALYVLHQGQRHTDRL